jgi:3-deoxy-manno-octulosonate cytidylyltransferase (CMP-KDO synthetase)
MSCLDRVVVATDSDEIADTVRGFGGEVCLTSPDHPSGTDRVAEVVGGQHGRDAGVVVNLQPDEPFLPASAVEAAVTAIRDGEEVATLAAPIVNLEELMSLAVVKVVRDARGRALYFSRSPIPAARDGWPDSLDSAGAWLRHIGLYAYTRRALERWVALPVSPLESIEKLEQLRALAGGIDIHVSVVEAPEAGIDTPEDLDRAERLLGKGSHV